MFGTLQVKTPLTMVLLAKMSEVLSPVKVKLIGALPSCLKLLSCRNPAVNPLAPVRMVLPAASDGVPTPFVHPK
jgi:hypothetical protein